MGNCGGKKNSELTEIKRELEMITIDHRVRNNNLLRELLEVKQILAQPKDKNRRYSYTPVQNRNNKITYV